MKNYIYVINNKRLSDSSFDRYDKNIIKLKKKFNIEENNNITILLANEKDKVNIKKYLEKQFIMDIEYLSCESKHISHNLDINQNNFNTLVRIIIQLIKINENDNLNTTLVFDEINDEKLDILSLIHDIFAIEIYQISKIKNTIEKIECKSIEYNNYKKYYQLLKKVYKQGYILENIMDKSLAYELKYILEENNGCYRLTPLGEAVFEKVHNDYGICNCEITTSLFLENIIESLKSKRYIDDVIVENIENVSAYNTFEMISNSSEMEIKSTVCDGRQTAYLRIKVNSEYDLVDVCIELEKRYCRVDDNIKKGAVEFILIRHADDIGEREKRIAGCYDFQITEEGHRQIELLSKRLKDENLKVDYIFTSPLIRAKGTADKIGEAIGTEVICYNSLEASNYGFSSGMTKREAIIKYPNPREGYIPSSNVWEKESEIEYSSRIVKAFYNIYHSSIGKKVMIVTHGRAISAIMREVMQLPASKEVWIKCDDTSIHQFVMSNNFVEIIKLNDTMHLKTNN